MLGLQDRCLQDKLNELSGDHFIEALNNERHCKVVKVDGIDGDFVRVDFGRRCYGTECFTRFSILLQPSEISEMKYDPKRWNCFPEVTPPQNVLMRIEILSYFGNKVKVQRCSGRFIGNEWFFDSMVSYQSNWVDASRERIRFRPWED